MGKGEREGRKEKDKKTPMKSCWDREGTQGAFASPSQWLPYKVALVANMIK